MGLVARLSRVIPLVIALAAIAAVIYLVVTYRHSPARAKEVLIRVFTWLTGIISGFFALASAAWPSPAGATTSSSSTTPATRRSP